MFYGYDYGDEPGFATEADAMREYAENVGGDEHNAGRQWILTDYDVWVRNPHYTGPAQPHPETEPEGWYGEENLPPEVRPDANKAFTDDEIPF